jgi:DNA-binding transcriptional ArsR family regulator
MSHEAAHTDATAPRANRSQAVESDAKGTEADLPAEEQLVVGPAALKGLAHPLRMRLLGELHDRGRATATQLAAALGESSGATSYHLRQLHRHGFIIEDDSPGTGRERYWRPVPGGWNLPVLDLAEDAASGAALDLVVQEQLLDETRRAIDVMRKAHEWPQEWRDSVRRMETRLALTPEQVSALHADLDEIIDRYRLIAGGPGSRRVVLTINTTPTEHPGSATGSATGGTTPDVVPGDRGDGR